MAKQEDMTFMNQQLQVEPAGNPGETFMNNESNIYHGASPMEKPDNTFLADIDAGIPAMKTFMDASAIFDGEPPQAEPEFDFTKPNRLELPEFEDITLDPVNDLLRGIRQQEKAKKAVEKSFKREDRTLTLRNQGERQQQ